MGRGRKRSQRPNATGRTPTSRFVRLDHKILKSAAYRSLSPNARALLVELVMLDNGENNGSLYLSVQDAAERMGVADHHAAGKAFDELQERGFIEVTQTAHFSIKVSHTSRARTWLLTWLAGPGRKGPSWQDREPQPGTRERKRMDRGLRALKRYRKARDQDQLPVVDSTMMEPFKAETSAIAVVDSTMLNGVNSGNPCMCHMVESPHHTAATMGSVRADEHDDVFGHVRS